MSGVSLLLLQAVLYFGVMAVLFRARGALGTGVFVCALGVMHFLETYLAAVFFIELPFGLISPGSVVLFSGKLAMVLLLYVKEDAETVRQPVYGLLIGNLLVVASCLILRFHAPVALGAMAPDLGFVDQMGVLMIWGTLLLFVDSLMVVLLYEGTASLFGRQHAARVIFCLAVVLTFDQLAFFGVLRMVAGVPPAALLGGWAAKMGAALVYGALLAGYFRYFETRGDAGARRRLGDLFDLLTYRREAMAERALERDEVTGALASRHLAALGAERFQRARRRGRGFGLLLVQVAAPGPAAPLREMAQALAGALRVDDLVFRHGARGFALLLEGIPPAAARRLAEDLPRLIPERMGPADPFGQEPGLKLRVAVADGPGGAADFGALLRQAEDGLWDPPGGAGAAWAGMAR
ncbi:nucleotidyl cyclase domain-containing protein [Roseomonas populi]|uniref:Vitamin uptake-like sensor domain-containing protein n=1 Tax=Roseomonas populi TaxID=3121582 RepID=A0ABT1XAN7_9PROT|nr:hypothetical protein [Roseomonas pecuniae]MCR0984197.1 hypothetical protein [Roseomonas pecuniae]